MSTCIIGGDEGKSSSSSGEIIELRWIDPDRWGRFAWNFLFGTVLSLIEDITKMGLWHSFIYTLPFALPCHSCKVCCARFLEASPPPSSGGESRKGGRSLAGPVPWPPLCEHFGSKAIAEIKSCEVLDMKKKVDFKAREGGACPLKASPSAESAVAGSTSSCGCTPDRARTWLCRLRRDVRARNLASGDTLTVSNKMQGHLPSAEEESDEEMSAKFTRRIAFPELWRLDAFVFLSTVILTAEYSSDAGILHLREFLKGALSLSALPLGLEMPSIEQLGSAEDAMSWLATAKFAPDPVVLQATLDVLPLRKRRVRRK